jgi:twinkle protein
MGKSVLVDELLAHCILTQDTPVWACKTEEPMAGTVKRVAGKLVDCVFHDPNIQFNEQKFDEAIGIMQDKLILFDSYQATAWNDVKAEIRHVAVTEGCKDFVIDPITCFTIGMSISEVNEELVRISGELAAMASELDFTAYVFCHLNAPQSGPAHERGGAVQSVQFAGSRSMMRTCHAMFGLRGNKDPELPKEERNRRYLEILEERNFGESGIVPLFYNDQTGRLKEIINVGE